MTSKEIYESIDQSKLSPKGREFLKSVEKNTKGFTKQNDKVDSVLKKLYADLKAKKPEALKDVTTKTVEKEVRVPTTKSERKKEPKKKTKIVKEKVEKATGKKKVKKPTKTPSTPKEGAVEHISTRASKLAKKEGISFKEARAKLSKEAKEQIKKDEKQADKELDKLLKFVRKDVFEDGEKYPKIYGKQDPEKSSLSADAKRMAKPVGKRVSKNGKTYYEYRDNRSDRNSLPAPKGQYKYKGKTPPFLADGGAIDSLKKDMNSKLDIHSDYYAEGGMIEIDEDGSNIPSKLQQVFDQFNEDEDSYKEMERLRLKAQEVGYDFDYDLSGQPTEFMKINKMAKGGKVNLNELSDATYRMAENDKKQSKRLFEISDDLADLDLGNKTFAKGGRTINIVNDGVKFDKSKYKAVYGDFDNDGTVNIDDANPLDKTKSGQVEGVELRKTFDKLLGVKAELDEIMYDAVETLDEKAPKGADIYARTKTPYSILKKLVEKRMLDPKRGLTDMIGTTIAVDNQKELEKVRDDIDGGLLGKVLDRDDFYKTPNAGYMAYHYIVEYKGVPVEVQLKTKNMKKLHEVSHEAYKNGTLNAKSLDSLSKTFMRADKGDAKAKSEISRLLKDKKLLASKISKSTMAKGGEILKPRNKRKGDIGNRNKKINVDTILGDRAMKMIYYDLKGNPEKEEIVSYESGVERIKFDILWLGIYDDYSTNNKTHYTFYRNDNKSLSNRKVDYQEIKMYAKGGEVKDVDWANSTDIVDVGVWFLEENYKKGNIFQSERYNISHKDLLDKLKSGKRDSKTIDQLKDMLFANGQNYSTSLYLKGYYGEDERILGEDIYYSIPDEYAKGGMTDVERQTMIDMGYTDEQIKEAEDSPRRGGRFAKGGEIVVKGIDKDGGEFYREFDSYENALEEISQPHFNHLDRDSIRYYDENDDMIFAKGGKIGFDGLAKKVAKRYEGKPVKSEFQNEYGKTYNKKEAMEVGRKVAGKVYRQQQSMEKGGTTKQGYDYVPQEAIDELSYTMGKVSKSVSGSNVLSGAYVKSGSKAKTKSKGANDLTKRLLAMTDDEDKTKVILEKDVKEMQKYVSDKLIIAFYLGLPKAYDFKGDYSYGGGVINYDLNRLKKRVADTLKNIKANKFEMGLKYPQYDFEKLLGKPTIKDVFGKTTTFNDGSTEKYKYRLWIWKDCVIGQTIGSESSRRGGYTDYTYGEEPTLMGGYKSVQTSKESKLESIAKFMADDKNGFVKDNDVLYNGLGGTTFETLDKNKIKYQAGGTLPTPFGQAGLVGETGTMNEMDLFAMGGGLPQGVHQYYGQTYNPAYPTPHGYAKGGRLPLKILKSKKVKTKEEAEKSMNNLKNLSMYDKDGKKIILRGIRIEKEQDGYIATASYYKKDYRLAKGGKMMQGYNDRLDESLGNRDGVEPMMMQSFKDRRDESKGMEKAMGRRAYQSVGTMDKMAKGGTIIKKGNRVRVVNTQYDGKEGLVVSNDLQNGNYQVQIDGTVKGFPFENLMLLSRETYAKGGKMKQGYNDRLDESLGNRNSVEPLMMQSYKDRRDESKGMEKSMGRRAYQSVGTMDKMAKGGEIDAFIMKFVKDAPASNLRVDSQELTAKLKKGGKLGRSKHSLMQDRRRVSSESWEVAYQKRKAKMEKGGEVNYQDIRSRMINEVGFDRALSIIQREDDVVDPETLIISAVRLGKLSKEEVNRALINSAESESDSLNDSYKDSGFGFGSSDMSASVKSILRDAGYQDRIDTKSKMEAGGTLPTPFGQAGLVGETGAMNEMDLFAMGGGLPQGVQQYYGQTYNPAYPTPHGYAKGGEIDEYIVIHTSMKPESFIKKHKLSNYEYEIDETEYDGFNRINFETYPKNQNFLTDKTIKEFYYEPIEDYAKGGKTQGYNDKLDESLGNTKGKRSTKEQNYKDRRNESEAMEKKGGKRKYARVKTMDKGNRKKRQTPMSLAKEIRKEGEKWQDAVKRASAMLKKK